MLRNTCRLDLALQALAHAGGRDVDYAQTLRAVVAHLSPALGKMELRSTRAPRLLPHAVVLGLTHAALTGRRPRA